MKVREIGAKSNEFHSIVGGEEKETVSADSISFKSQLTNVNKSNYQEVLNTLAAEINSQGALICKRCDIKELKKYKELISTFLQEAVKNSYEIDKQGKFDGKGQYKIYAKIKKINQKVEMLTEEMLKEQADPIEILKKIEDIKGLILDILL